MNVQSASVAHVEPVDSPVVIGIYIHDNKTSLIKGIYSDGILVDFDNRLFQGSDLVFESRQVGFKLRCVHAGCETQAGCCKCDYCLICLSHVYVVS